MVISLEVDDIKSDELANMLNNMRERWNSTRIYGKMFDPVYQTSPTDPMWIFVFTLSNTWTQGIRNLILIIENDDSNQKSIIHIVGKNLKHWKHVEESHKLETEFAQFVTEYLRSQ